MKRWLMKTNVFVLAVVLIGILVLGNVAFGELSVRWDLTEKKDHSLSKQTVKTLENLQQPVDIYFFGGGQDEDDEIEALLKEYAKRSDHIKLHVVNPNENPSLARKYDVQSYGTTVFVSGKETKSVEAFSLFQPGASPDSYQFTGEEQFTQAIMQVTDAKKERLLFLQGHGEPDPRDVFAQAVQLMEGEGYQVETVNLAAEGRLPKTKGTIVIAGPTQDISDKERQLIGEFLAADGKIMVFLPPSEEETYDHLSQLLSNWGVKPEHNMVIDPERSYFNDPLSPVPLYEEHMITSELDRQERVLILPRSRGLAEQKQKGLTVSPLLKTSDAAWGETDLKAEQAKKGKDDTAGPLTIGYAVEAKATPKAVILGNVTLLDSQLFTLQGNADFVLNSLHWLNGDQKKIAIRPQERKVARITLTPRQADNIFLGTVVALPLFILLSGVAVWWRRRQM